MSKYLVITIAAVMTLATAHQLLANAPTTIKGVVVGRDGIAISGVDVTAVYLCRQPKDHPLAGSTIAHIVGHCKSEDSGKFQMQIRQHNAATDIALELFAIADGHAICFQYLEDGLNRYDVTLNLSAEQPAIGRLIDANGQPIANAKLSLASLRSTMQGTDNTYPFQRVPDGFASWPKPLETDSNGAFPIDGLSLNCEFILELDDSRAARQRWKFAMDDPAAKELELKAHQPRHVQGAVIDTVDKRPLVDALVRLSFSDHGSYVANDFVRTDKSGQFSLSCFYANEIGVKVTSTDMKHVAIERTIPWLIDTTTLQMTLHLDPLGYHRVKLGFYCLHQYNKTTGQTKVFEKIKLQTQVEISEEKTYMANNKGIGILQGDSIFYLYKYPIASNIYSYDFREISPGLLAIAGCSGLLRFTVATHKLDTIYSRENACFGGIWKYKDYIFWGSYGYGYYVYKNGVIKEMPIDKNQYLLYCHCFVPDAFGFCWISTNRGLFKVKLDEITAHFENSAVPVYYHYFGKKDGIEMTELNGGCSPCALMLRDQTISFPSMDGLLWVNPITANPVLPSGDIYVDEALVDNKSVNPDSLNKMPLAATVQEVIIKLGFSAWCNKENIYLDYQLNDTTQWIPVNTDNDAVIRLINLSPGKYKLRIRKLNGFGINNFSYKEVSFTISTPWQRQWWFFLLCLAAIIGITALFFHLRTRQYKIRQYRLEKQVAEKTKELQDQNEILEKNNSIKTRLISIISHDIVTPLRFVTVAGKKLIEKRSLMSEALQQETIQEITNTSQELQLLSTNILNWIKYQNENRRLAKEYFTLHETINQVLGVLNSLAKQKKLTLENRVDEELKVYQYFEPLKILIYNLLTNAINFSEKGAIIISAKPIDDQLEITVADEGVGMTADQIKNIMADQFIISSANIDNRKGNGLGYLIIKDLVKTMSATLHINSEKGKGTTVAVRLIVTKSNA